MTIDEQLTVDLWILDAMLTGRDPRSGRGDTDKLVDAEKFIFGMDVFYLSDGGYSRVGSNDRGVLFLTSNSRAAVKELWDTDHQIMYVRRRIELRLQKWIQEHA